MSLNFLTKSMWEYTRIFDILKYYYSSQLRVCMCGNSLANVLFSLVYLYLTYVCYLVSRQERLGERMYCSNVMCNIIYACVTSHVQNHVVKVFEPYMCSTCDCESIYFTWAISHLLFMLDKSNPETFQMVVCCISFFFNSTFICFFSCLWKFICCCSIARLVTELFDAHTGVRSNTRLIFEQF